MADQTTPLRENSVRLFGAARTPGRKGEKLDRFIPSRSNLDTDHGLFGQENQGSSPRRGGDAAAASDAASSPAKAEYQKLLAASLNVHEQARVLAFKHKAPAPPEGHDSGLAGLYSANLGQAPARKQFRHVPTTQERILDAPDLVDDYYLNLLDWSSSNVIAVALGPTVYLWNAGTGSVEELCTCKNEGDYVSSVQWAPDSSHLAVGTSDAKVQIWDAGRAKQVRELAGHTNRVSALAWNGATLSSGGRDSVVCNWDVRKRKDEALVATLRGHDQEVCGLKWSPSGSQLASGGNDNVLCIWDARFQLQHRIAAHQAAVKALAWCPFQSNLLASGGGTADRHIRFWNTLTGAQLNAIDTGSQVCALQWSRHEREILSSHGYSKNQLCLWKYPTLAKAGELTGHTARVLHMAQSPDGASVVTAGADETLRFWRAFGEPAGAASKGEAKAASAAGTSASMLRSVSLR
ncbi:MAG: activator and specificity subunit of anaphase promoting complex [Monoraphidium minutum]|nr:MAG: activator and specificity subunit of anaphase promoting complex [Monoraphidium minutum]